jgi:hypothetical protein
MAGISKKVDEQNTEVAPAEASGIDVSKQPEADLSKRGIEHEGISKAQYFRALLISAALAMLAMICLIAVVAGIDSGSPAAND